MADGKAPSAKGVAAGSAANKALLYGGVALVAVAAVAAVALCGVCRFAGADAVAGRFREAGLLPLAWLASQWPLPALAIALPPSALAGAASGASPPSSAGWCSPSPLALPLLLIAYGAGRIGDGFGEGAR